MNRRGFLQAGIAGIGAAHLGCSSQESLPAGPPGRFRCWVLSLGTSRS